MIETRTCHYCGATWTGETDAATATLPLPIDYDPSDEGRPICDPCYYRKDLTP